MSSRSRKLNCLAVTVLSLLVVACSGGGGGSGGGSSTADVIQISDSPRSTSAAVGAAAAFTVTAAGAAPLAYQWYRNGHAIAGATAVTYSVEQVSAWHDGDQYQVRVNNGANLAGVMSVAATLAVNPAPGIDLVAGKLGGPGNLDGNGAQARFFNERSIAVDPAGVIYLDGGVRKITPAGVVSTASQGVADFDPMAFDTQGNFFRARDNTIWKTTPAGVQTVLAGGDGVGTQAQFAADGLATDAAGNVYVADRQMNTIFKVTPSGMVTTLAGAGIAGASDGVGSAAQFFGPHSLTTDPAGNVYVGDDGNATVRKISPSGVVTTFAGKPGEIGSTDGIGSAARFGHIYSITSDAAGNLYVTAEGYCTIRKITPDATVSTLAGTAFLCGYADGIGPDARFGIHMGIATDAGGNLVVRDEANFVVRKVTPSGVVTTLAGNPPHPGSDDGVGAVARINSVSGTLGVDATGNIYFGYSGGMRKLSVAGVVSTLPNIGRIQNSTIYVYGTTADAAGNGYGVNIVYGYSSAEIRKFSPDGTVTTLPGSAGIDATAIAVDGAGNVYAADNSNRAIRRIAPDGAVTWFAYYNDLGPRPSLRCDHDVISLTTDAVGNVYASWFTKVFRITPSGAIALLAGSGATPCWSFRSGQPTPQGTIVDGTGSSASFFSIGGMATDAKGNVYLTDANTVRKITPAGVVTTIAGQPSLTGVALGPLPGSLNRPTGIAVVPSNSGTKLVIMDEYGLLSITAQ